MWLEGPKLFLSEVIMKSESSGLFSFFSLSDWGINFDCCDVEWFVLETN